MSANSTFSELPVSSNNAVIKSMKDRREKLERALNHCLSELNKINTALSIFSEKQERRFNWTREVIKYFAIHQGPQKTTEILKWIFSEYQIEIKDAEKRRIYITGLSVALMNLVKKGKLKSISKPGEKGRYYFLVESGYNCSTGIFLNTTKMVVV